MPNPIISAQSLTNQWETKLAVKSEVTSRTRESVSALSSLEDRLSNFEDSKPEKIEKIAPNLVRENSTKEMRGQWEKKFNDKKRPEKSRSQRQSVSAIGSLADKRDKILTQTDSQITRTDVHTGITKTQSLQERKKSQPT